jgi:hypothetical protein
VVDGAKVVLVPKKAVRWRVLLDHRDYYNGFVLDYLQSTPEADAGLAYLARGPRGLVTKQTLREHFPLSKDYLLRFSREHPDVFQDYKESKSASGAISNAELADDFDPIEIARYLIRKLRNTPVGAGSATQFQRLGAGIMSFLFYPNLITPRLEDPVDDGRRRIDVTYVNAGQSGLFQRFTPTFGRASGKIVVEFKNYRDDPENPEVDQVLGRFANHRGWLGFLVSRHTGDRTRLDARCRDLARNQGAYIVPLDDSDLIAMLEMVERNRAEGVLEFVAQRFGVLTR